jgi:hypothetical protein
LYSPDADNSLQPNRGPSQGPFNKPPHQRSQAQLANLWLRLNLRYPLFPSQGPFNKPLHQWSQPQPANLWLRLNPRYPLFPSQGPFNEPLHQWSQPQLANLWLRLNPRYLLFPSWGPFNDQPQLTNLWFHLNPRYPLSHQHPSQFLQVPTCRCSTWLWLRLPVSQKIPYLLLCNMENRDGPHELSSKDMVIVTPNSVRMARDMFQGRVTPTRITYPAIGCSLHHIADIMVDTRTSPTQRITRVPSSLVTRFSQNLARLSQTPQSQVHPMPPLLMLRRTRLRLWSLWVCCLCSSPTSHSSLMPYLLKPSSVCCTFQQ